MPEPSERALRGLPSSVESRGERVDVMLISSDTAAGSVTLTAKLGPSSYRPLGSVVTGRGPLAAVQCVFGGEAFVALSVSDENFAVDVASARVIGRVGVGWAPRSMTPVPGTPYLLVANAGSNSLSIVDVPARAEAVRIGVGREPGQIAVCADGTLAVLCERGDDTVAVLDLSALMERRPRRVAVASRTWLGAHVQPRATAISGDFALIAAARADVLTVLALPDGRVEATVALPAPGACPAGIAVTGQDGYALVSLERAGSLAVVDLLEWTITPQIPIGAGPRGLTIDPDDQSVYCALTREGSLAVVHLDGVDLANARRPQREAIRAGSRTTAVTLARTPQPLSPDDRLG
ncbi:YncE family protein [Streptomyces sp. NPDC001523]|uniref:YncE family protein n=1 Tax=Streptomyces sp. NPDC001523 TaxID=3154383 RepID=UPI0033178D57